MITRVCKECGEEKELDLLVKQKGCKHGRRALCKKCNVKKVMAATDPVAKAEYDKKYREANAERYKEYEKERRALPHRKALNAHHSRMRKTVVKEQTPAWANQERIRQIYEMAQDWGKRFNMDYHVDHIEPLRGDDICGLHVENNLQLLAAPLNISKGNSREQSYPK